MALLQPPGHVLRAKRSAMSVFRKSTSHPTHSATDTVLLHAPLIAATSLHFFSTSTYLYKKAPALPPRPTLPDATITHTYLKGSGPGGQKINKTNSAAQLTHLPTGIVVKSQATRSRSQNYTIARRILAEKVELLEKGDESRVMKRQERDRKRKASKSKKSRRKYRALEREEGEELDAEEDEEERQRQEDLVTAESGLEGDERVLDGSGIHNGSRNGTEQAKPSTVAGGKG